MSTLQVRSRMTGKVRALRRAGLVPGVVYGPTIDSTPISIARKDLQALFSEITRSSRVELAIEEEGETRELEVFLKVVDYDPITDEPLHVDFYHPGHGRPLKLHVPIKTVGESAGVKSGGILNVLFNSVLVHGLPRAIPHLITLDVSELDLGESIHVRDVDFGDAEPLLPPERTLVTVIAPRGMGLSVEEEAALEAEELLEAEEGEGAAEEGVPESAADGEVGETAEGE